MRLEQDRIAAERQAQLELARAEREKRLEEIGL